MEGEVFRPPLLNPPYTIAVPERAQVAAFFWYYISQSELLTACSFVSSFQLGAAVLNFQRGFHNALTMAHAVTLKQQLQELYEQLASQLAESAALGAELKRMREDVCEQLRAGWYLQCPRLVA